MWQLFDNAGAVTDTFDYDAFGNLIARTGTTANSYLYRGEQFDADLGFYFLRARYYGQQRGRFWTVDPYPGEIEEPITLHKYLYAGADPVNHSDPSGYSLTAEYGFLSGEHQRNAAAIFVLGLTLACVYYRLASEIPGFPIDDIPWPFQSCAKGGKQNLSNEWSDEAKRRFGSNKEAICKWLEEQYKEAEDAATRLKIKLAQKFLGCRQSSGGGGK